MKNHAFIATAAVTLVVHAASAAPPHPPRLADSELTVAESVQTKADPS